MPVIRLLKDRRVDVFYGLSILLACCYVAPMFGFFTLAYLSVIIFFCIPYYNVAPQLRAQESASRSPLSSYITECYQGRTTLRAFGALDFGLTKVAHLLEAHIQLSFNLNMTMQWFQVRLSYISAVAATVLASYQGGLSQARENLHLICIVLYSSDVSLAAFLLVLSLELFNKTYWCACHLGALQLHFNSIGRLAEYCVNLKQEKHNQELPPAHWPARETAVQVENLTVRYAKHLPAVLKNVSFAIKAQERVAVIGRTVRSKHVSGIPY